MARLCLAIRGLSSTPVDRALSPEGVVMQNTPWARTLGAKLGVIFLVLLGVSVALVFANQRMLLSIKGDAAATNQLGLRSEEHTSELQSLMRNSYAVFSLKQKTTKNRKILSRSQKHTI